MKGKMEEMPAWQNNSGRQEDDEEWSRFTAEQFLYGYGKADATYDKVFAMEELHPGEAVLGLRPGRLEPPWNKQKPQ